MKFRGKMQVGFEYENNKEKMQRLITKNNDITPLLGKDWLKKFNLTIRNIRLDEKTQSENKKVIEQFLDLYKNNTTIQNTEVNLHLKLGH